MRKFSTFHNHTSEYTLVLASQSSESVPKIYVHHINSMCAFIQSWNYNKAPNTYTTHIHTNIYPMDPSQGFIMTYTH